METIKFIPPITVKNVADAFSVTVDDVLQDLWAKGCPKTVNENSTLDPVIVRFLGMHFGFKIDVGP
jgi:hypothetical protein